MAKQRTDADIQAELRKISKEMTEFDETNMSVDDLRAMRTRLGDRLQELSDSTSNTALQDRAIGMNRALGKIVKEAIDGKDPSSGSGGGGGVTVKPYTRSKADLVEALDRITSNMRAISRTVKAL